MEHRVTLAAALILSLAAWGCSAGDGRVETRESASASREPDRRPAAAAAAVPEVSVYGVKNHGSDVPDGARVRVASLGLRVTAARGRTVFVQEAGDDGACERESSIVAYRAIEIAAKEDPPASVVRGARVVVEGLVTTRDGRRTIENAVVTVLDEPIREYLPHCDRNSSALYTYPLDAVLVLTAGVAEGPFDVDPLAVDPADGTWLLTPCSGDAIRIGMLMARQEEWTRTWLWLSGTVRHAGATTQIEPRDDDDIGPRGGNDVCL